MEVAMAGDEVSSGGRRDNAGVYWNLKTEEPLKYEAYEEVPLGGPAKKINMVISVICMSVICFTILKRSGCDSSFFLNRDVTHDLELIEDVD
jgi:hypothetical protein